jgi:plasmid maintenance system killer protein
MSSGSRTSWRGWTRPRPSKTWGFRLHQLKGDLKGFWSLTAGANWRIIFRFADGVAFDIELVDHH